MAAAPRRDISSRNPSGKWDADFEGLADFEMHADFEGRANFEGPRSCYEYLAQQGALAASDFGMFGNEKTVATRSRPETPDADQSALRGLPMPSHGEANCCDPGRQMAAMKEEAKL